MSPHLAPFAPRCPARGECRPPSDGSSWLLLGHRTGHPVDNVRPHGADWETAQPAFQHPVKVMAFTGGKIQDTVLGVSPALCIGDSQRPLLSSQVPSTYVKTHALCADSRRAREVLGGQCLAKWPPNLGTACKMQPYCDVREAGISIERRGGDMREWAEALARADGRSSLTRAG